MRARVLNFLRLLLSISRQDLQDRFAGSLLGALWLFIWPLIQLVIYIVIFGKLMGARLGVSGQIYSYGLYLASGLLAWTLFATALSRCIRALLDRSHIIRKVRVNLAIFPSAIWLTELFPFAAGMLMLAGFDLATGWLPELGLFAFFLLAFYTLLVFGFGLGLFFACAAVFVRDVVELVPVILQIAFWFTPIVYLPSILPQWVARWIWLNPMTGITRAFQQFFALGGQPDWFALGWAFFVAHFCLALGVWILVRWQKDIRDAI